jgi:hypothetical protein
MIFGNVKRRMVQLAVALCCCIATAIGAWGASIGEQPSAFDSRFIYSPPNPGEWAGEHALARAANGTLYAVYGGHALYMATKRPTDTEWSVQVVDDSYRVGKHNSIALDSNGYPHISYSKYSDNVSLKYARWDGSAWQIETVDGQSITDYAGCNNAIALDSNDLPYIVYLGRKDYPSGEYARNLMYAHFNGTSWQTETVDANVDINEGSYYSPVSIAVDSTGIPHISYQDYRRRDTADTMWTYNNDLWYAARIGGTWTTQAVDADGNDDGAWNSIAVDSAGAPHIAYVDYSVNDLKYATLSGAWVQTTVDTDSIYRGVSIAIGGNQYPQIGYSNYTSLSVDLAKWDGAVWNTESVFDPNYTTWTGINVETISIVVNSSNQATLLFNETSYGKLVLCSTWSGSAWQTEVIDQGGSAADRNDVVTDKNGFAHVSYRASTKERFSDTGTDYTHSTLMYARWDGTQWVNQAVAEGPALADVPAIKKNSTYYFETGMHSSIALDSSGTPHFSFFEEEQYYDGANWQYVNKVKHATWDGAAWVVDDLVSSSTTTSNNYPFTSIAVDSRDRVHISYYDETNKVLMYINQDAGGAWTTPQVVDDCGRGGVGDECGNWSDLDLDSKGNPHISYHDRGDGELMYAYWDGSAWQTTVVDDCSGSGYCGKSTSIALDSADNPHISYRDGGWDDGSPTATATAKYAYKNWSGWNISTVATRVGGGDTSIALDKFQTPHISYFDGFYKAPAYATSIKVDGTMFWLIYYVEDRRSLDDYVNDYWEDQGPQIGHWNALAVDNYGRPQFVYSHNATQDIRHAGVLRGPYFPWILFTPAITGMGSTPAL